MPSIRYLAVNMVFAANASGRTGNYPRDFVERTYRMRIEMKSKLTHAFPDLISGQNLSNEPTARAFFLELWTILRKNIK